MEYCRSFRGPSLPLLTKRYACNLQLLWMGVPSFRVPRSEHVCQFVLPLQIRSGFVAAFYDAADA
jgi:hypothetical protein